MYVRFTNNKYNSYNWGLRAFSLPGSRLWRRRRRDSNDTTSNRKKSHCLLLEVTENRDHLLINVGIEPGAWLIADLNGLRQCVRHIAPTFHKGKIVYKYYISNTASEQFISGWQQRINSRAVYRPVYQYHAATLA